jgi:hypothetical protein
MSRSYRVLALALVGVLVMVGLAQVIGNRDDSTPIGAARAAVPATAVASTVSSTTSVPESTAAQADPASDAAAPASTGAPSTTAVVALSVHVGCSARGSSAAVDREAQRAWLCEDGALVAEFPITSAWTLPDPGTFQVYAKDMNASSNFGGHYSTMTHFVAFTYGENTGARVAFHSVPMLPSGELVQPLESVGDPARRGESSGCIRVRIADAVRIWDALAVGDTVTVLN